jgi:hypothetical protein
MATAGPEVYGDEDLQMAATEDEHPVEALAPQGANNALTGGIGPGYVPAPKIAISFPKIGRGCANLTGVGGYAGIGRGPGTPGRGRQPASQGHEPAGRGRRGAGRAGEGAEGKGRAGRSQPGVKRGRQSRQGFRCPTHVNPSSSLFVPSGQVVSDQLVPVRLAPPSLAPSRSEDSTSASVRLASVRLASVRLES